jgi:hypothetical protein
MKKLFTLFCVGCFLLVSNNVLAQRHVKGSLSIVAPTANTVFQIGTPYVFTYEFELTQDSDTVRNTDTLFVMDAFISYPVPATQYKTGTAYNPGDAVSFTFTRSFSTLPTGPITACATMGHYSKASDTIVDIEVVPTQYTCIVYQTIGSWGSAINDVVIDEHSLTVFPMPANDKIYVQFNPTKSSVVDLSILDINGRLLKTQSSQCH